MEAAEHVVEPVGFFGRLYGRWLSRLERGLVVLLALLVVWGGCILIIASGDAGFYIYAAAIDTPELATVQTVVYALTFYLCLFGAVLATRRANHIAIDAVTPHLSEGTRRRVEGVLLLICAGVAVFISATAQNYVSHFIPEDHMFIPGKTQWFWSKQLWRWPAVLAFSWMALHFVVGGALRVAGREPHEFGLAPPPHMGFDPPEEVVETVVVPAAVADKPSEASDASAEASDEPAEEPKA